MRWIAGGPSGRSVPGRTARCGDGCSGRAGTSRWPGKTAASVLPVRAPPRASPTSPLCRSGLAREEARTGNRSISPVTWPCRSRTGTSHPRQSSAHRPG
ncbi:hypothetical protein F7661_15260 [Pseudomonas sp. CFA]|nr:hypothetical protein F7661_15260 [Pseudomonas sp. CFA]